MTVSSALHPRHSAEADTALPINEPWCANWVRTSSLQSSSKQRARGLPSPVWLQGAARGLHVMRCPCLTSVGSSWAAGPLPVATVPRFHGGHQNRHKWGGCFHSHPFCRVLLWRLIDTSPPSPERNNFQLQLKFSREKPLNLIFFWFFSLSLSRCVYRQMSDLRRKQTNWRGEGWPLAEGWWCASHLFFSHWIISCTYGEMELLLRFHRWGNWSSKHCAVMREMEDLKYASWL